MVPIRNLQSRNYMYTCTWFYLCINSIHCILYTVYSAHCFYALYTVQCTVYSEECTLYFVYCTLNSEQCALRIVYYIQCTVYNVYSVQCIVYYIHCAVYTIYNTVQSALYILHYTAYTMQCIPSYAIVFQIVYNV